MPKRTLLGKPAVAPGDGTMRDASFDAGVTLGRWAWNSNFVDINNDGRDDIVVANGFVTGSDDHDL